jgi:hypothetical protein
MTASSDAIINYRRRPRIPPPLFVRVGDFVAELIIVGILLGGFLTGGYAQIPRWMWMVNGGCAFLGTWAVAGLLLGRWQERTMRASLWFMAAFTVVVVWSGLQLVWYPSGLVTSVSPLWSDLAESMAGIGMERPEHLPLAVNSERGWRTWSYLVSAWGLMGSCCLLAARRSCAIHLILIVVLATSFEGLWGLYTYVATGVGRTYGALFNSNHHAALVALGIPLIFASLVQSQKLVPFLRGKLTSGSNPLLILYGIALLVVAGWLTSFSRGSIFIAGIIIGVWLIVEWYGRMRELQNEEIYLDLRSLASGAAGLLLVGAAGVMILESADVRERLIGRVESTDILGDAGRVEYMRASLAGLLESPWVGLGLEGVEGVLTWKADLPMTKAPVRTHSDPVQLAAEMGIPVTFVLLGLMLPLVRSILREWTEVQIAHTWSERFLQRAALAGALGCLVHSFADFHLRIPLTGYVFLIVLALSLNEGCLSIVKRRSGGGRQQPAHPALGDFEEP